ncbi:MAG: hypothetical protein H6841_04150 [Planctomycetes bacterium]|nr:hypothetical protein [Planctomycetota bacterium]MCB9934568.1 hypothetical protein [Planctomycetota bacterium]
MKLGKMMLAVLAMICLSASVATLQAQEKGAEGEKPAAEKKADEKAEEGKEGEEGEEGEEKEEDPVADFEKVFKDVDKVVDSVKVTDEDIQSFLKHNDSFDEAMEKDEKFEELKDKNIKEAFDHAVKSEIYKAWADKNGLKAEDWLRKAVRIMVLNVKVNMGPSMAEQAEMIAEQRKMVEGMKDMLGEEEYKEAIKAIEDGEKTLKGMTKVIDGLPAGTDEEKKLIEKYAEKLAE